MHEYSTLSKRARIAARIMFLFSHVIVFTTSFEKNIAVADCPWIARKSIIVPIGSNVPFLQNSMAAERDIDVAYFGHIAPGKGIETFLFVCSRLAWDTSVYLIGATPEQFPVYWQKVVSDCNSKGITVQLNKPLGEVGSLLARCKVALLPFPDGFSMRRGSALAAQANGALVVTTQPHPGSEALCEVAFCCSSEEEMLDKIVEILADKDHKYDSARQKAYDYARQFSWPQIANAILVALSMPVNDAGATLAKA
jgi:glycosyltransferase involved in cell wall biosynthesis